MANAEKDPTEMNGMINDYLDNYIEPSYRNLHYDGYDGRVWYDYDTVDKLIEEKRDELLDKLERLEKFKQLISKNGFPDRYKGYLFDLLRSNAKMFCKIMNEECEYERWGADRPQMWEEVDLYIDYGYCTYTAHGPELCKNCKFYLDVAKEYEKMNHKDNSNEMDNKV